MATIPVWAVGRHVTACTMVQQSVDSAGLLSDSTSRTLFGFISEVGVESSNELENISEMGQRRKNMVAIETGTTIVITELLKSNGTNLLAVASYAADVMKVTLTRGGQTFVFYGIVESYSEALVKGSLKGTLRLAMVDPGSANPTYT